MDGDLGEMDVGAAAEDLAGELGELDEKEELTTPEERTDLDFGADPAGTDDADKAGAPTPAAKGAEVPAGHPPSEVADPNDKAPATWKPEVAAAWATLPPEVKEEVRRREYDIARYADSVGQAARVGNEVANRMAPILPMLAEKGIDPWKQTHALWEMWYNFNTADHDTRLQQIVEFAQMSGLDLTRAGQVVPDVVMRMQQRIRELEGGVGAVHQQYAKEIGDRYQHEIEQLAADTEKYPFFWDVSPEMVELLRTRQAKTLPEAYEKAKWMNPIVRAKEADKLAAERQQKANAEAQARADAARKAARANVRSSYGRGSRPPSGSVDQTLNDAYDKIVGSE